LMLATSSTHHHHRWHSWRRQGQARLRHLPPQHTWVNDSKVLIFFLSSLSVLEIHINFPMHFRLIEDKCVHFSLECVVWMWVAWLVSRNTLTRIWCTSRFMASMVDPFPPMSGSLGWWHESFHGWWHGRNLLMKVRHNKKMLTMEIEAMEVTKKMWHECNLQCCCI
jgi:hypothetical protein